MKARNALLTTVLLILSCTSFQADGDIWGPECYFKEGPDIRPTASGELGDISECPCYLTGIVNNPRASPAYYVHVVVTVYDRQTRELIHAIWTQVGSGTLQPGQEEFVRFSVALSDLDNPRHERRITLRWKEAEYHGDVDCRIESTFTRYEGDTSAFLCGFIGNTDIEAGFAPTLQARVLDLEGKTANILRASVPRIPLEPGERLPFVLTIPAISPTDTIILSFE